MSNSRFGLISVLSVTIIPAIAFCMAAKPNGKESLVRGDASIFGRVDSMPDITPEDKDEWAAWRSLSNRGMAYEGLYTGDRPASNTTVCSSVVTNTAGNEGQSVGGNYWLQASFDWICGRATSQVPCQTVTVVTIFNEAGEWEVLHHDNGGLTCGDNTYEISTWTLSTANGPPPPGHYTANVDIYGGTWATWTPTTPLLGADSFGYTIP